VSQEPLFVPLAGLKSDTVALNTRLLERRRFLEARSNCF